MSVWSSYKDREDDQIDVAYSVVDNKIRLWIMNGTDKCELSFADAYDLADKIIDCVEERRKA